MDNLYDILKSKSLSERHLNRYIRFINSRNLKDGRLERHHICPRAEFPEFESFADYPWNKIDLSPREHYIAHLLLWKIFGGSQTHAIYRMTPKNKRSSRMYETFRSEIVEPLIGKPLSENTKAKMKGRVVSDEVRLKMSKSHIGKTHSSETKEKMSKSARARGGSPGWKHSNDSRAKMSQMQQGRVFSEEHKARLKEASRRRWGN